MPHYFLKINLGGIEMDLNTTDVVAVGVQMNEYFNLLAYGKALNFGGVVEQRTPVKDIVQVEERTKQEAISQLFEQRSPQLEQIEPVLSRHLVPEKIEDIEARIEIDEPVVTEIKTYAPVASEPVLELYNPELPTENEAAQQPTPQTSEPQAPVMPVDKESVQKAFEEQALKSAETLEMKEVPLIKDTTEQDEIKTEPEPKKPGNAANDLLEFSNKKVSKSLFDDFMICAVFLKNVLGEENFSLKRLNSEFYAAAGKLADYTVVNDVLNKGYINIMDSANFDENSPALYTLTADGVAYFESLQNAQ